MLTLQRPHFLTVVFNPRPYLLKLWHPSFKKKNILHFDTFHFLEIIVQIQPALTSTPRSSESTRSNTALPPFREWRNPAASDKASTTRHNFHNLWHSARSWPHPAAIFSARGWKGKILPLHCRLRNGFSLNPLTHSTTFYCLLICRGLCFRVIGLTFSAISSSCISVYLPDVLAFFA